MDILGITLWYLQELLMIIIVPFIMVIVAFIMVIPFLLPLIMCMSIVVKWDDDKPSRCYRNT
jgi:hypothetical protein